MFRYALCPMPYASVPLEFSPCVLQLQPPQFPLLRAGARDAVESVADAVGFLLADGEDVSAASGIGEDKQGL